MVSINLLPDVKKEYLKSQRTKRTFVVGSLLVSVVAVGCVILAATYVLGVQKLQIYTSQNDIDKNIITLNETQDLARIVTVQNQLSALPTLHESKTATTRLFNFLKVLTPNDVSLSSIEVDFEEYTIEIKGGAKDFKSINTFVDTLKNASYLYTGNEESAPAFSSVVLGTIGKDDDSIVGFKITLSYNPAIFDNTIEGLKLTVPNITSTRSETEKPNSLFDASVEQEEE